GIRDDLVTGFRRVLFRSAGSRPRAGGPLPVSECEKADALHGFKLSLMAKPRVDGCGVHTRAGRLLGAGARSSDLERLGAGLRLQIGRASCREGVRSWAGA